MMISRTLDKKLDRSIRELKHIFTRALDKHEANFQSRGIIEEMAQDPAFLTAILHKHLVTPGGLNRKHYPVVGIDIALNPFFGLVANCWLPLPDCATDISTKAIHHHGTMLLTTVTIFGPGYAHWTFTPPEAVNPACELFSMEIVEQRPHSLHHVAFVDSYIGHVPFYPPSLTITLALWSNTYRTSWKDRLKRLPFFTGRERALRQLAARAGLTKALDLKVVEYFDFYPTRDGFKGMKERVEFERGSNVDYLHSLFHILQQTGNEGLAPLVQQHLDAGVPLENTRTIQQLVRDLRRGCPIEGRLSEGHVGVPHANFTKQEVERALVVQRGATEGKLSGS